METEGTFYPQQLRGEDGDGGGSISNLVILNLRHIWKHNFGHFDEPPGRNRRAAPPSLTNQNFGGRVIDPDGFEDGRSVIGHRHSSGPSATEQDFILARRKCSSREQKQSMKKYKVENDVLRDIKEEKNKETLTGPTIPLGPKVLLTRSPMAMAPTKDDCRERTKSWNQGKAEPLPPGFRE